MRRHRYLPHAEPDHSLALYLNLIATGFKSPAHNHPTWVVIVAMDGEERHRIYERIDDGSIAQQARLRLQREAIVRPGQAIACLSDDIHSIEGPGTGCIRHFHLYRRALETLEARLQVDRETGAIVTFGSRHLTPLQGDRSDARRRSAARGQG